MNAQYSYNKGLTRTGTKTFSVGLDGSIKLTPYWNINGSTYYDVVTGQLAYTRIGFPEIGEALQLTSTGFLPEGRIRFMTSLSGLKQIS